MVRPDGTFSKDRTVFNAADHRNATSPSVAGANSAVSLASSILVPPPPPPPPPKATVLTGNGNDSVNSTSNGGQNYLNGSLNSIPVAVENSSTAVIANGGNGNKTTATAKTNTGNNIDVVITGLTINNHSTASNGLASCFTDSANELPVSLSLVHTAGKPLREALEEVSLISQKIKASNR